VIRRNVTPAPVPKSFEDALELSRPLFVRELGPVVPGKSRFSGSSKADFTESTTDIVLPPGSYKIEITTRNNTFSETLALTPSTVPRQDKKDAAERIEVTDEKGRVLFRGNYEVSEDKGEISFKPERH
jgi:hypothetical protein